VNGGLPATRTAVYTHFSDTTTFFFLSRRGIGLSLNAQENSSLRLQTEYSKMAFPFTLSRHEDVDDYDRKVNNEFDLWFTVLSRKMHKLTKGERQGILDAIKKGFPANDVQNEDFKQELATFLEREDLKQKLRDVLQPHEAAFSKKKKTAKPTRLRKEESEDEQIV
jgi:hypothetical protein